MFTKESLEILKRDLRSVLIAEKDGLPIQNLEKEFTSLTGEELKFDRELYPNLLEFLLTIPDACIVRNQGYETLVFPISSAKNVHIQELVQGQKDNKYQSMKKARQFNLGRFNGAQKVLRSYINKRPYARSFPQKDNFNERPIFSKDNRPFSPISRHYPVRYASPIGRGSFRRYGSPSPKRIKYGNDLEFSSSPHRSRRHSPERSRKRSSERSRKRSSERSRRRSPNQHSSHRSSSTRKHSPYRKSKEDLSHADRSRSIDRRRNLPAESEYRKQNYVEKDSISKIKSYLTTDPPSHKASKKSGNHSLINSTNQKTFSLFEELSDGEVDLNEAANKSSGNLASTNSSTAGANPPKNVLQDPRKRAQSFAMPNRVEPVKTMTNSFYINSRMNSSFDIRSQENKIPVKLFNCTPTPVAQSKPQNSIKQSSQDSSDKSSDDEFVMINPNLIRKIRDHSPNYRKKQNDKSSKVLKSSLNSSATLSSLDDCDYTLPSLITDESLRKKDNGPKKPAESQCGQHKNDLTRQHSDLPTLDNISFENKLFGILASIRMQRTIVSKALLAIPGSFSELVVQTSNQNPSVYISSSSGTKVNQLSPGNFIKQTKCRTNESINYKLRLKRFCKEQELSDPIFEPGVCTNEEGLVGYYCNLLIDSMSWCTLLNTHSNPNDAENSVSKIALEELKKKLEAGRPVELDEEKKMEDHEIKYNSDLVEKITKLFTTKNEKLYSGILEKRFLDVYQQKLTQGWLDSIKSSKYFVIIERQINDSVFTTIKLVS